MHAHADREPRVVGVLHGVAAARGQRRERSLEAERARRASRALAAQVRARLGGDDGAKVGGARRPAPQVALDVPVVRPRALGGLAEHGEQARGRLRGAEHDGDGRDARRGLVPIAHEAAAVDVARVERKLVEHVDRRVAEDGARGRAGRDDLARAGRVPADKVVEGRHVAARVARREPRDAVRRPEARLLARAAAAATHLGVRAQQLVERGRAALGRADEIKISARARLA